MEVCITLFPTSADGLPFTLTFGSRSFLKPDCHLCENAMEVIDDVLQSKELVNEKIPMSVVNINKDQRWWKEYCFDIPVLHIEDTSTAPRKLTKIMHFFKEEELLEALQQFKD
ncbi:Mgp12p KNAG_0F03370 [Huiozyma naganishii CBS 8797]|uniref:Glutaredoxin-like protein n=1 Tax=Huiozyma naganishii (strain ATCC MYA-139 / BCRC 22969 / CBS 8797 / KCTC 17520 / NBRC 10181 / NCYC 3082 / Yp74L-3) TaxID=1071383 RepID=J7S7J8_HUIN7|nr:hypothetical protein KNAG_0F03370 [Kazachstania naganishii CBS 8797]CCK70999.1 hypothetical protein KNAG_0F03370 [Kazachstania naganishii CBS 8797]